MEPLAQFGGRRHVLQPAIKVSGFLGEAARPEPLHQHPPAVGRAGFLINAFDGNGHVIFYNKYLTQKLNRALPPLRRRRGGGIALSRISRLLAIGLALAALCGCQAERRKSDAELGLNPTQVIGRQVFDRQCGGCHEAYSSHARKGPSLQGLFKHPYLKNGMPANDERVREIVVSGRAMMPAFSRALTPRQVDELMEYLHTL